MKRCSVLLLLSAAALVRAEETKVTPMIGSVGLFKNGLATVEAVVAVPGPGDFRWDEVPSPIHGSFWIESDCEVDTLSTTRRVEVGANQARPTGEIQHDLAGQEVKVTFKTEGSSGRPGSGIQECTGTVWTPPAPEPGRKFGNDYDWMNESSRYWWGSSSLSGSMHATPGTGSFLILVQPDETREFLALGSILSVTATKPGGKSVEERPALVFHVNKAPAKGGTIRIRYLTRGLAWMPSYRIELGNRGKGILRMAAQVRNEKMELADTELKLISGYPNIRFANVDSPLTPAVTLEGFFRQLSRGPGGPASGIMSNSIASQVVVHAQSRDGSDDLEPVNEPGCSSDDLHFRSIGRRSLKPGDTISLNVAQSEVSFDRIVDWTIPDRRNPTGRYDRNGNQIAEEADAWDAVRFRNPFDFPMTTAPAMVADAGNFRGQSETRWTNPGQSTSIRITKALSVRTSATEVEEEGGREVLRIGGSDYQRVRVKCTLTMDNFRDHEVAMVVSPRFSGELIEAAESPKSTLRADGVISVNPRRELEWTLKLPPSGSKTLTYRYAVLVPR